METIWNPKYGEVYWCGIGSGEIVSCTWFGDSYDDGHFEMGNCFKTKEEVEYRINCIKYQTQYKRYLLEHNDVEIDFKNDEQYKYYASYDCRVCKIRKYGCLCDCIQGVYYATSEQVIQDFIGLIGENNFIKYVLEAK